MQLTIEKPPSWATKSLKDKSDPLIGHHLTLYEPLFFRESNRSKSVHIGPQIVVTGKNGILDMATLIVDGDTGRLSLRHQSLEPIKPPIEE